MFHVPATSASEIHRLFFGCFLSLATDQGDAERKREKSLSDPRHESSPSGL
jgi:hypothetical protein